jgi:hypothetical protein
MNHNKMDEEKDPKENVRSGLMIGGWFQIFERTSNCGRGVEK